MRGETYAKWSASSCAHRTSVLNTSAWQTVSRSSGGGGVALDVVEGEVGVARRLRKPGGEVGEGVLVDEVVAREHRARALADDGGREQLGERGRDGLQKRPLAHEVHVGVDCETGRGQHSVFGEDALPIEPQPLAQVQPLRDAPLSLASAVVVHDALRPLPAQIRVDDPRHQGRVLDGDSTLVVVAVERPGLNLSAVERSIAHQSVEGMVVVVALGSDPVQPRFQRLR